MESASFKSKEELEIIRIVLTNDNSARRQDVINESSCGSSKTTELLMQLRERGILRHNPNKQLAQSAPGRSPHVYAVNPTLGAFVGIAVNNVYDRLALIDFSGEVTGTKEYEPSYKAEQTIASLQLHLQDFIQSHKPHDQPLRGITLGLHGIFDERTGTLYRIPNQTGDVNLHAREEIERTFGVPVHVCHAKYLLMLHRYRFSPELNNGCIVNLHHGYGVGMGISFNGTFMEGGSGLSGEIGHTRYADNDRRCYCGQVGCLRTLVSYQAIVEDVLEKIRAGSPTRADLEHLRTASFEDGVKHIVDCAIDRDTLCMQTVYETGTRLGVSLGTAVTLLNPDVLVIHSDLSRVGELFTAPLRYNLQNNALTQSVRNLSVEFSVLEPFAAPIGGGLMALKHELQDSI
ncbi:MAG: ROK family protein [Spirochaetota bacterium]